LAILLRILVSDSPPGITGTRGGRWRHPQPPAWPRLLPGCTLPPRARRQDAVGRPVTSMILLLSPTLSLGLRLSTCQRARGIIPVTGGTLSGILTSGKLESGSESRAISPLRSSRLKSGSRSAADLTRLDQIRLESCLSGILTSGKLESGSESRAIPPLRSSRLR
jgi:hypothetical protein